MRAKRLIASAIWGLLFFLAIVITPSGTTDAYLDPGSGSFIVQAIIAGLLGLLVTLRLFWNQILSVLGIKRKTEEGEEAEETPAEPLE